LRRLTTTVTTFALSSSLALGLPGSATAATGDFGNTGGTCTANVTGSGTIVMIASAAANPIPTAAPSSGVITRVQVSVPSGVASYPVVVKVLRAIGSPNQYTTLRQTAVLPATAGVSSFAVRLPVSTGDVLGTYASSGTRSCLTGSAADTVGLLATDTAPGSTATFSPENTLVVPLVATIEPDVDGDGFSDVTQDLCPTSAKTQAACPAVTLDSVATAAGRSITALVVTDNEAPVSLSGTTAVKGKLLTLTGGTRTVAPATLTSFTLKLPRKLKRALSKLGSSRSIKVTLTATATDVIGRTTTDQSTVKLRGRRS